LADLYAGAGSQNIRLFTDSDNLTEEHGQALRRRFQTAPIPVDPALFAPVKKDRGCGCATILYLGDARTEKGYLRLPAIARELQNDLAGGRVRMVVQSNFNVPGGEPGIASARDFLMTTPNVMLQLDPLTPDRYNDYIFSADLILLPYQVDRYISRTSGILAEAICAGVPAIVPQGTWLSEQVRRHGAGMSYNVLDRDGASRAVAAALESLETLSSRAEERRAAYAQFHNPVRLARFVCGGAAGESHRR
jgi:glycosyltransferase involved in cell wall biosynthesis